MSRTNLVSLVQETGTEEPAAEEKLFESATECSALKFSDCNSGTENTFVHAGRGGAMEQATDVYYGLDQAY